MAINLWGGMTGGQAMQAGIGMLEMAQQQKMVQEQAKQQDWWRKMQLAQQQQRIQMEKNRSEMLNLLTKEQTRLAQTRREELEKPPIDYSSAWAKILGESVEQVKAYKDIKPTSADIMGETNYSKYKLVQGGLYNLDTGTFEVDPVKKEEPVTLEHFLNLLEMLGKRNLDKIYLEGPFWNKKLKREYVEDTIAGRKVTPDLAAFLKRQFPGIILNIAKEKNKKSIKGIPMVPPKINLTSFPMTSTSGGIQQQMQKLINPEKQRFINWLIQNENKSIQEANRLADEKYGK